MILLIPGLENMLSNRHYYCKMIIPVLWSNCVGIGNMEIPYPNF